MKTIKIHLLIIFLLFNGLTVFSQWEYIYSFYADNGTHQIDFSFSSPQIGWVSYIGHISPSSGQKFYLKYTNDYGNTWNSVSAGVGGYYPSNRKIIAAGADTIYCFAGNEYGDRCLYSYDGGMQWSTKLFEENVSVSDAFYVKKDTLIVTANYAGHGRIYRYTPDSIYTLMDMDTSYFYKSRIFFANSRIGYLIIRDASYKSVLLSTNDGGENWTTIQKLEEIEINDLYFTSDSVGYFACFDGRIFKTTDYGVSLSEMTTPTNSILWDIQFINDSCGYCVGFDRTCIYTTDYGLTWSNEIIETFYLTEDLKWIQMFSMDYGYIISRDAIFYRKNNIFGIDEDSSEPFCLYPNPVLNYLRININSNKRIDEISIYNMLGIKMIVHNVELQKIDVSHFDSGLYFINIKIDNKKYVKKIIKK